jgi:hypothetical protein
MAKTLVSMPLGQGKAWMRRWGARGGTAVATLLLWTGLGMPRPAWAGLDDRPAVQAFVSHGALPSRRLQQDLVSPAWGLQELRASLAKAYGVEAVALSRFLDTPAGEALLRRQLPLWSTALPDGVRLQALKAAIVADAHDGAISVVGVLARLPVRFELASASPSARPTQAQAGATDRAVCVCPEACGRSTLAHFAFLIACLQAGAMGGSPP